MPYGTTDEILELKKRIKELETMIEQSQEDVVSLTSKQIEVGAKKLSELFDYPWEDMPEKGKHEMRGHVLSVFEVIEAPKERGI